MARDENVATFVKPMVFGMQLGDPVSAVPPPAPAPPIEDLFAGGQVWECRILEDYILKMAAPVPHAQMAQLTMDAIWCKLIEMDAKIDAMCAHYDSRFGAIGTDYEKPTIGWHPSGLVVAYGGRMHDPVPLRTDSAHEFEMLLNGRPGDFQDFQDFQSESELINIDDCSGSLSQDMHPTIVKIQSEFNQFMWGRFVHRCLATHVFSCADLSLAKHAFVTWSTVLGARTRDKNEDVIPGCEECWNTPHTPHGSAYGSLCPTIEDIVDGSSGSLTLSSAQAALGSTTNYIALVISCLCISLGGILNISRSFCSFGCSMIGKITASRAYASGRFIYACSRLTDMWSVFWVHSAHILWRQVRNFRRFLLAGVTKGSARSARAAHEGCCCLTAKVVAHVTFGLVILKMAILFPHRALMWMYASGKAISRAPMAALSTMDWKSLYLLCAWLLDWRKRKADLQRYNKQRIRRAYVRNSTTTDRFMGVIIQGGQLMLITAICTIIYKVGNCDWASREAQPTHAKWGRFPQPQPAAV